MAEIITPQKPDVLGLCEFQADPWRLRDKLNDKIKETGIRYEFQPGYKENRGYGTDIWYNADRFEALEGGKEKVYCYGTRGGSRGANWVVLKEKMGARGYNRTFITGGIHLSYCRGGCYGTHKCEIQKLYQKFSAMRSKYGESTPIMWMGDLNRDVKDDLMVRHVFGSSVLRDFSFKFDDFSKAERSTFTYTKGKDAIDHIVGTLGFHRVEGGNTGPWDWNQLLNGADHHPVYAVATLGGGTLDSSSSGGTSSL
jgi:hypothetical protein